MISALLYKDMMVLWRSSKLLLVIMAIFLAVGAVQPEEGFFLIYPSVALCTMSLNSLSYDERYGWGRYADALPYGRRKAVTAKYLLSLLSTLAAMALYLAVGLVNLLILRRGDMADLLMNLHTLLMIATAYTVILLPLACRFGMEKARIGYIIVICTVLGIALNLYAPGPGIALPVGTAHRISSLLALPVYAVLWTVSWRISVAVYQKKEF